MTKRYFIQVDKAGRPLIGSLVFTVPKVKGRRLVEITDYIKSCCTTTIPALVADDEKFYILLDRSRRPISGSVTNIKPQKKVLYADITLAAQFASCCSTKPNPILVTQTLTNFVSAPITTYPVGVFNYSGDYVGVANNSDEYVTLWNSNTTNSAKATLYRGETPFKFKMILKDPTFTGKVKGLNFFTVKHSNTGTLKLNVDDNAVVVDNGNGQIFYANAAPIVPSSTNAFFAFSFYNWNAVPTFNYRNIVMTSYSGGTVNVFHNDVDVIYAHDSGNSLLTISGRLPIGLKYFFIRPVVTTNFDTVTNWMSLTQLQWFEVDAFGGVGAGGLLNGTYTPVISNSHQLKGLWLGEFRVANFVDSFAWVNATNFPQLTNLLFTDTGAALNTYNATFWQNLPKVTNLLRIYTNGGGAFSSAVSDAIFNQLAINLNGIVPSGDQKLIRIEGSVSVTAASLTARNYLIAQGWTITLS
jgi:hypothetical protein